MFLISVFFGCKGIHIHCIYTWIYTTYMPLKIINDDTKIIICFKKFLKLVPVSSFSKCGPQHVIIDIYSQDTLIL